MNAKQKSRRTRLMPRGIPRYVRCYDDGGKSIDRYTAAFTRLPSPVERPGRYYECLAMSSKPFHPQGFGQHSVCMLGSHLGRRIRFQDLPPDCQKAVRFEYRAIWSL